MAPQAALRRVVVEFARLGGAVSALAPAAPPLQDRLQVVLAGTAAQFDRFMGEAAPPLAAAVRTTLRATIASPPAVTLGRHQFHFASRVYVAGILNNTPDSFYDRGRYYGPQTALARADEMVREGADVIEVGGETAQQGDPIPAREEIERVAPLVVWLCTEAARNVNGRTLYVCGDEIGLFSEPELVSSLSRAGGWDLDSLDNYAGERLIGELTNDFVLDEYTELKKFS